MQGVKQQDGIVVEMLPEEIVVRMMPDEIVRQLGPIGLWWR